VTPTRKSLATRPASILRFTRADCLSQCGYEYMPTPSQSEKIRLLEFALEILFTNRRANYKAELGRLCEEALHATDALRHAYADRYPATRHRSPGRGGFPRSPCISVRMPAHRRPFVGSILLLFCRSAPLQLMVNGPMPPARPSINIFSTPRKVRVIYQLVTVKIPMYVGGDYSVDFYNSWRLLSDSALAPDVRLREPDDRSF
jgi:hypothetical protein